MQALLGIGVYVSMGNRDASQISVSVFCVFASVLIWGPGLRAVNHLGVQDWKKRMLAVGVVFPGAIISGFGTHAILVVFLRALGGTNLVPLLAASFLGVAWVAVLFGLYLLAQWVAEGAFLETDPTIEP